MAVANSPAMFRKVQSTEIFFVFGFGALHLNKFFVSISTNIEVLCTCCVTSVKYKKSFKILRGMRLLYSSLKSNV